MDESASERRRAFSFWLRTGQLPIAGDTDIVELKFNPWHDWVTGRFTFAGADRHTGSGAGGFIVAAAGALAAAARPDLETA